MKRIERMGSILAMIGGFGLAAVTLYEMLASRKLTVTGLLMFVAGSVFFVRGVFMLSNRNAESRY